MVDILFLGTGGGRFNLVRQLRGTGGFLLLGKHATIHVDPGPGALLRLHAAGLDPQKTDALIVTHMHVDHVSDAGVLIEAMNNHMLSKGGVLVASRSVLAGDKHGDKSVSTYHQSKLDQCIALAPAEKREIKIQKTKIGASCSFSIQGVPVKHDDRDGFGFVLTLDGVRIGYTSDTEYLPVVHDKAFAGVDALIANNLKAAEDGIPDHLNSGDLIKLLSKAKPKLCILSHMGMKLIVSGPELEAARIQSASGVPTVAGRDGWYYCTDRCGWFKPKKGEEGKGKKGQKTLVLPDESVREPSD
ncbi:MAG: MBL fold metallo-hydrolase [Candidatus Micrarchaeota archaeon]